MTLPNKVRLDTDWHCSFRTEVCHLLWQLRNKCEIHTVMYWRSNRKSGSPSEKIRSPPYFYFWFGLQRPVDAHFRRITCPMIARGGSRSGGGRFVRAILLPVRTPLLRRVFRDSDHAECRLSGRLALDRNIRRQRVLSSLLCVLSAKFSVRVCAVEWS